MKVGRWLPVVMALTVSTARAEEMPPACPPVALIDGPPVMVQAIETILQKRGFRESSPARCPGRTVKARIESHQDKTGFTLTTVDDAGRTSTRVFVAANTAASLIESWAGDEDSLILPPRSPAASGPSDQLPGGSRSFADSHVQARTVVYGGPETSIGSDRSWWFGINLGACVRVGAVCTGARLRSTRDADVAGASKADTVMRNNTDVLLSSSWLLRAGQTIITPTAAIGVGWLRTTTEGGLRQDAIVRQDRGARAELSVVARRPISVHVALGAELAATWSPFASTQTTVEQGASLIGEPDRYLHLGLFCLVTP